MGATNESRRKGKVSKPPAKAADKPNEIRVPEQPGKTREQMMAAISMSSVFRNAHVAAIYGSPTFSGDPPGITESTEVIADRCAEIRRGGIDLLTDQLTAQLSSLDTMFTEMSRRAASNLGTYPETVERYMNLALKAQANYRITAETVARIKRGGQQTVKVVHVHEGGQAVVADTFNHGGGGGRPAENSKQPHGKGAPVAALSGPDQARDGVPLPSHEGQEPVPIARGEVAWSAAGK